MNIFMKFTLLSIWSINCHTFEWWRIDVWDHIQYTWWMRASGIVFLWGFLIGSCPSHTHPRKRPCIKWEHKLSVSIFWTTSTWHEHLLHGMNSTSQVAEMYSPGTRPWLRKVLSLVVRWWDWQVNYLQKDEDALKSSVVELLHLYIAPVPLNHRLQLSPPLPCVGLCARRAPPSWTLSSLPSTHTPRILTFGKS